MQLTSLFSSLLLSLVSFQVFAGDASNLRPQPGGKPADMTKPVQVFILMGQSNMVGAGKFSGGSSRWGKEFIEPVVSVYPGDYDPHADYDALKPEKTLALPSFGGVAPTPYPGGGVQVVRGLIQPKETGLYEFNPGYGESEQNIMIVNGVEVHRKAPGGKRSRDRSS